jgi:hypothetical protein
MIATCMIDVIAVRIPATFKAFIEQLPRTHDTLAKIKQLFDANVINLTFLFY